MKYLFLFLLCSLTTLASLHAKIRIKTIVPVTAEGACDGSLLIEAAGEAGPFTVYIPELELSYHHVNGTLWVTDLCIGIYTVEVSTTSRFQCTKSLVAEIAEGFAALTEGGTDDPTFGVSGLDTKRAAATGEADFILYPNPTNGRLQLRLESFREAPVQLSFFAANGQRMYRFRDFQQQVYPIPIDLSSLPPGTYFAVLQDQQGKTYTRQLVIRP